MSMHGLNNLINNNVQLQRLDDINNNVRHQRQRQQQQQQQQQQHYNLISIHHIISTSYNHHVKFNIGIHIIIHQHIYMYQFINHIILDNLNIYEHPILQVLPSIPILNPNSQILLNNNKTTC